MSKFKTKVPIWKLITITVLVIALICIVFNVITNIAIIVICVISFGIFLIIDELEPLFKNKD